MPAAVPVLNLLDVRTAAMRAGQRLTTGVRQRVHGATRLDRTGQLRAAHAILVVTALFESLDDLDLPFSLHDVALDRTEQAGLVGAETNNGWAAALPLSMLQRDAWQLPPDRVLDRVERLVTLQEFPARTRPSRGSASARPAAWAGPCRSTTGYGHVAFTSPR